MGQIVQSRKDLLTGPDQTRRFMQTLDYEIFSLLERSARARGVTVQGLIRAVIVPAWIGNRARRRDIADFRSVAETGDLDVGRAIVRVEMDRTVLEAANSQRPVGSLSSAGSEYVRVPLPKR